MSQQKKARVELETPVLGDTKSEYGFIIYTGGKFIDLRTSKSQIPVFVTENFVKV